MRVYFEKPRTTVGWKGLINDPHLDGSGDVNSGLRMARELLLDVLDLGLAVGCEFLDPITPQYIADTVAWGAIGARTSESQMHRQLGSGLSMPIGFKNRTDGNVQVAVDAVRAAAARHAFAGIDDAGAPAILHTTGNRDGHVILRGGDDGPNYSAPDVARAVDLLKQAGLPERVVIDASHGNSAKDPDLQVLAAREIAEQIAAGNGAIVGVMLESFIVAGRQDLGDAGGLTYGQSITDACLDWERTAVILDRLAGAVEARRSTDGMRIAVLGVGLIGGSIGLAARRRLEAEVTGFDPDARNARARARARRARPQRRARLPRRSRAPTSRSAPRPVRALPELVAEAIAASGDDTAVTDVGSTKRELRRGPAAADGASGSSAATRLPGAETAGVENARPDLFEGARWYLTPTDARAASTTTACSEPSPISAPARRRSRPRRHDRMMATISHLPHVLANALASTAAAALGEELGAPARGRPELSRRHPRRRRRTRRSGPTSSPPTARASRPRSRPSSARLAEAAELIRAGDRDAVDSWHRAARRRPPRACSRPSRGRHPPRAADDGLRTSPGRSPRSRSRSAASRRQHRGHGALPGRRHAHRRDLALGRGRRRGRARRRDRPRPRPLGRARRRGPAMTRFEPRGPLRGDAHARRPTSRSPTARRYRRRWGRGRPRPQLPRRRRHRARPWRRSGASAPRSTSGDADGAGGIDVGSAASACAAPRAAEIDVGNAGTLLRLLPGLARRSAGGHLDARRRRVDPPPPGRPRRRAAAADGRRRRVPRRAPAAAARRGRRRCAGIDYELPVASAQVKSCLLLAGLLADGRDRRGRAGADPRPHRADAARRGRARRVASCAPSRRWGPPARDRGRAGRAARARRRRGAGRLLLGRLLASSPRRSCPAARCGSQASGSTRPGSGCSGS